jgi:probable DNA metabolism protein
MRLCYDGTFEGFLSLVYEVYTKKLKPISVEKQSEELLLFETQISIQTSQKSAQKVFDALKKQFTKEHFKTIINIFLCESEAFEYHLLRYIILGFKSEKNLNNINDASVFYIQNLQKELFKQVHKYKGFTRFIELEDGLMYAKIEPKYSIAPFLAQHFFKRLNSMDFIIHDTKRALAAIKTKQHLQIKHVTHFEAPTVSKDEAKFQMLWKTFFQSVSIESRQNKALQQSLVPLLYRNFMTEFLP